MTQFPDFFTSQSYYSESPPKDTQSAPVGAGSSSVNQDPYYYDENFIKWIQDAKQKIPRGTPTLRKEAFLADPLIKGTIFPFQQNTLLKDYDLESKDNELYAEAISEVEDFIVQTKLMKVFRDSFLDLHFLVGRSYHRIDYDKNDNITHLEKLEPNSITTYVDPWDSSIVAYHQHINVNSTWSGYGSSETVDSWFVPYSGSVKNINDTYIEDRVFGNSVAALFIFNVFKNKYKIGDVQKLRVAASERVIPMESSVNIKLPRHDDDFKTHNFAPIDSVLVQVFLKSVLARCSPNLIDVVLNPLLHITFGKMEVTRDINGNSKYISSLPDRPISTDPDYAVKQQKFNDAMNYFRELSKNAVRSFKEGGVLTTFPDVGVQPVESSRNINHQFVKGFEDLLDDEIFYNFGLPRALVSAKGSELATSRTIESIYDSMQEGKRRDYEEAADDLIRRQFEKKKWTVKTKTKNKETGEEKEETIEYTLKDMKLHFKLKTLNTKNQKEEAETFKARAEGLVQVKALGASKEDIQAHKLNYDI
jgi:hypothetical protein